MLKRIIFINPYSGDGVYKYDNPSTNPNNIKIETISLNLDQQLSNEGFSIKRIVNYRTSHNKVFDNNFINKLKANMPDIVYIYSQNSASSFLNFIKINQSESIWMNTNLMCIGEKTSSILNEIKWKKIFLFNPGEEEFLLYKI